MEVFFLLPPLLCTFSNALLFSICLPQGLWEEDSFHGQGEWTFDTGKTKKGLYLQGRRVKWIDEDAINKFLPAGKALMQGHTLPSQDGKYYLQLGYNGFINIIETKT